MNLFAFYEEICLLTHGIVGGVNGRRVDNTFIAVRCPGQVLVMFPRLGTGMSHRLRRICDRIRDELGYQVQIVRSELAVREILIESYTFPVAWRMIAEMDGRIEREHLIEEIRMAARSVPVSSGWRWRRAA